MNLAELKVVGELSDVQWMVLLTASVAGLFEIEKRRCRARSHDSVAMI